jgi:phospholipid-binding lipoprotein MlaA
MTSALHALEADPYEGFNRKVFAFNEFLDRWLLKPAAKSYRWVTPEPVDDAVTRVFSNLGEIRNLLNAGLQGDGRQMAVSSGRFLLNSTVGIAGIFDVATGQGLAARREDFGQTLAVWGVNDGPYIVLPIFGGRTLRDGAAIIPDIYTSPITYIDDDTTRISLQLLEIIDTRADLMNAETLITGDRYTFLRDVYLQKRASDVANGALSDDFDDDF